MESVKIFVRNFESLMASHGEERPSVFCEKINKKLGYRVFGPSYWSKIKASLKQGEPQNISLKIVDGTAKALGVEPWQLLNPTGFDNHGQSRASAGSPDSKIMEDSVRFALRAAEKEDREEDIAFVSKVAVASYMAHVSDQKDDLIFNILKIARETASDA